MRSGLPRKAGTANLLARMLFGKKREKTYLALDVGTEVIKALVCTLNEGNVEVIGVSKKKQSFAAMRGGVIANLRSVVSECRTALAEASAEVSPPDQVLLGIAGELVKGVMVEAKFDRENVELPITRQELVSVVERAKADAKAESEQIYSTIAEGLNGEIVEVGAIVADTKVDGYIVEEAEGMQGKSVEMRIFYTYAPRLHVGYLHSLAESLGLSVVGILPEPFTIVRAIANAKEESFNGIIIDIGGGTTDIAIVKQGILIGTEMVALGGRVFTKRIAQDLMINFEEAEAIKLKYSQRELINGKAGQIKDSLRKDIPVWLDGVELALQEYEEEVGVFPEKVMLCGGGSLLPEIKTALVEYPWLKRLSFNRAPSIEFLAPTQLSRIVDKTMSLTKTEDVTPLSLARFGAEVDLLSEKK